MAKTSSKFTAAIGRLIKVVMVAVLVPLVVGLLFGTLEQLAVETGTGGTFRAWIGRGFFTYVGVHLLLYRPVALFRVSRQLFSWLAVWLFGGQVTSMEHAGAAKGKGPAKGDKGDKGNKGEALGQGSPLVAFSPYVIPLYTVLVCALGWLLTHWIDRSFLDAPVSFMIGVTIAFHWVMTADELQQQRSRWHLETYFLAIGLVFVVTLLLGAACLPWAVPDFSFVRVLSDGFSRAQAIYTTIVQRLFSV